jgi:UDP-N-acetylmuramoylalanine--D-glutamate ligase
MLTKKQQRVLFHLSYPNVLILGAGREGLSTYRFLRHAFPRKILSVADQNDSANWSADFQEIIKTDSKIRVYSGSNYLQALAKFQIILKTPGIPPTLPEIQTWLADSRHTLTSNTELFFKLCSGRTIGVTGTKGKSTTGSLIFHILSQNNLPTILLGNIGVPPLDKLAQIKPKTLVVMELSAHQLQGLTISPHLAVLQNITSEHLDYYQTTQAYVDAKASLVRYQKKTDFLIYNLDFPVLRALAATNQAQQLTYSLKSPTPSNLVFVKNQTLFYRDFDHHPPREESVANLRQVKLKGQHNLQNIIPAVIIGKHYGLSGEQIGRALKTFSPLRHRLEWVAKINNVDYYNDSLSTTPESVLAALAVFSKKQVILLAGGMERHQNYEPLTKQLLKSGQVPAVITFATTGDRLTSEVVVFFRKHYSPQVDSDAVFSKKHHLPEFHPVTSMSEAVLLAQKLAAKHSTAVVLLSPGAASFNLFKDYADRGDQFIANVKNLL